MKKLVLVLFFILSAHIAYSQNDQFVRITPETQETYKDNISVDIIEEVENMYKVTVSSHINTWFIACENGLSPKDQNFRQDVWSNKDESKKIVNLKIYYDEKISKEKPKEKIEFFIDKELMTRSYIYQDAPAPVEDGGYYFTVDLATYINKE